MHNPSDSVCRCVDDACSAPLTLPASAEVVPVLWTTCPRTANTVVPEVLHAFIHSSKCAHAPGDFVGPVSSRAGKNSPKPVSEYAQAVSAAKAYSMRFALE
jgi:hypothetical protein